jgi:hypothetical protein
VPTPYTVIVSAASTEDATKSASVSVIVAGTMASVSQRLQRRLAERSPSPMAVA